MASREAERLWQTFRDARAVAPPFDLARERELAGQAGEAIPPPFVVNYTPTALAGVPVLRVDPKRPVSGVPILWIHGGAFTLMSAHTFRHWAGYLAVELRRSVVVPDYSLAPEHPYPAALDEIVGVYQALTSAHPGEPIVVVGDSAGGALAVGLQLRLRGAGATQPALTVLISPWLDLTLSNPSVSDNTEVDVILNAATLRFHAAAYLNSTSPTHPTASPAHAELAGLTALVVMAAEYDLLIDDAVRFARRGAAAGVDVDLEIAAEMPHCFQFFVGVIPEADAALARIAERIRARLG